MSARIASSGPSANPLVPFRPSCATRVIGPANETVADFSAEMRGFYRVSIDSRKRSSAGVRVAVERGSVQCAGLRIRCSRCPARADMGSRGRSKRGAVGSGGAGVRELSSGGALAARRCGVRAGDGGALGRVRRRARPARGAGRTPRLGGPGEAARHRSRRHVDAEGLSASIRASIAASELGVFITDGLERFWQLAPGAESWTLLASDCPGCEL
jgi:hypothetical protein